MQTGGEDIQKVAQYILDWDFGLASIHMFFVLKSVLFENYLEVKEFRNLQALLHEMLSLLFYLVDADFEILHFACLTVLIS